MGGGDGGSEGEAWGQRPRPERARERTWKQHSRAPWARIQGADTALGEDKMFEQ